MLVAFFREFFSTSTQRRRKMGCPHLQIHCSSMTEIENLRFFPLVLQNEPSSTNRLSLQVGQVYLNRKQQSSTPNTLFIVRVLDFLGVQFQNLSKHFLQVCTREEFE